MIITIKKATRFLSPVIILLAAVIISCSNPTDKRGDGKVSDNERLNFLIFFVDDLGYFDIGIRNSKFHTPKIDRLASESLEFAYAYVPSPTCSPSRVGLYTGRHPARLEFFRHVPGNPDGEYHLYKRDPANLPSRNFLPLEVKTYAEAIKEQGYNTVFAGKWHLGEGDHGPQNQGFDRVLSVGKDGGSISKYLTVSRDDESEEVYTTDLLTDSVVNFLSDYNSKDPFLLQLSYWNVHTPTVGRKDLVKFYEERGLEGVEAEYAAQVTSVDESVGRVLNTLEQKGLMDNTIIIFASDQGSYFPNTPLRGTKAVGTALYEGAARIPFFIQWPGVTKPGATIREHVSTLDLFPTIMEIAGGDPAGYKELDGLSLTSLIREGKPLQREYLFFYRAYDAQYAAVLANDGSKLVAYRGNHFELYNIYADISEENDLSNDDPAKLEALITVLKNWELESKLLLN
jgi:arylsulfatase A-like enzyme